jgi:hypothetical protein
MAKKHGMGVLINKDNVKHLCVWFNNEAYNYQLITYPYGDIYLRNCNNMQPHLYGFINMQMVTFTRVCGLIERNMVRVHWF